MDNDTLKKVLSPLTDNYKIDFMISVEIIVVDALIFTHRLKYII